MLLRCLAVAVAILISLGGFAEARSLKRSAGRNAMAQASTTDWSGFYVGLNVGGIRGGSLDHYPNGNILNPALYPPGGPAQLYGSIPSGTTWIGGLHFGYLMQRDRLVYGYEADFSIPGIDRSYNDIRQLTNGLSGTFQKSLTYKVDWISTVRGRIGFAFDRALLYATGGLAFASIDASSYVRFSLGGDTYTTSATKNRVGYAVGGGLDYALTRNLSVRQEYLYVDLGTQTQDSSINGGLAGYYYTAKSSNQFHILRVGLTYKFD